MIDTNFGVKPCNINSLHNFKNYEEKKCMDELEFSNSDLTGR